MSHLMIVRSSCRRPIAGLVRTETTCDGRRSRRRGQGPEAPTDPAGAVGHPGRAEALVGEQFGRLQQLRRQRTPRMLTGDGAGVDPDERQQPIRAVRVHRVHQLGHRGLPGIAAQPRVAQSLQVGVQRSVRAQLDVGVDPALQVPPGSPVQVGQHVAAPSLDLLDQPALPKNRRPGLVHGRFMLRGREVHAGQGDRQREFSRQRGRQTVTRRRSTCSTERVVHVLGDDGGPAATLPIQTGQPDDLRADPNPVLRQPFSPSRSDIELVDGVKQGALTGGEIGYGRDHPQHQHSQRTCQGKLPGQHRCCRQHAENDQREQDPGEPEQDVAAHSLLLGDRGPQILVGQLAHRAEHFGLRDARLVELRCQPHPECPGEAPTSVDPARQVLPDLLQQEPPRTVRAGAGPATGQLLELGVDRAVDLHGQIGIVDGDGSHRLHGSREPDRGKCRGPGGGRQPPRVVDDQP